MLQMPISDLDIDPGHVVEWQFRSVGTAGSHATAQQRRGASFNQDKHFSTAVDARRDHEPLASWVACTFELPGRLDRAAFDTALEYFMRRHEVLRCEFEQLTGGDVSCAALTPDEVAVDHMAIGDVDTPAEMRAYIHDFFVKNIDTLEWPLIALGAVERTTHTTVFLAFDHLVSDGMSTPIAVNDLTTAYTAALEGREPELPVAGSYVDFGQAQRTQYRGVDLDDPRLDYWRGFKERNGGFFPPFPLDLDVEPGEMYPVVNETDTVLEPEELDELEVRCREHGSRLSAAVLAATGIALRKAGGLDVYRGMMPVSERGKGSWRYSLGWFVNTMPIEFPVAANQGFGEVLAGVDAAFHEMLANVQVPFVRAWQLLAPELATLRSWPYAVNFFSYIDFRKVPGPVRLADVNAKKHIWASHSNGICHWFHRNESGLSVNVLYADTTRARSTKDELHGQVVDTMHQMVRHGTV